MKESTSSDYPTGCSSGPTELIPLYIRPKGEGYAIGTFEDDIPSPISGQTGGLAFSIARGLRGSVITAGLVVLGLCLRFGGEQFMLTSGDDFPIHVTKYAGAALYVCGWLIAAICLSFKYIMFKHCIFSMILVSVIWAIFEYNGNAILYQPKLPLISCSMFLSLLLALTLEYRFKDVLTTFIASSLIIVSEYFVLPFQRDNNINDGIGLPLLLLGWFVLFHAFDHPS
jgi:hypothetical protein